jgi:hypothetical protein
LAGNSAEHGGDSLGDTLEQHPLGWSVPAGAEIGNQHQGHVAFPESNRQTSGGAIPRLHHNLLDFYQLLRLEMR